MICLGSHDWNPWFRKGGHKGRSCRRCSSMQLMDIPEAKIVPVGRKSWIDR